MTNPRAHGFAGQGAVVASMVLIWLASVLATAVVTAAELPDEQTADWQLRTNTDNIRIYTTVQPDSKFKAFKAEAVLDVPIENLMAVMVNPNSCTEWVHNCSESYAFGTGDFHDRYAYSVNDMPWPVTDRDYVLRIRTRGNQANGEIIMNLNATPDQRAESGNRIRVDRSDTRYRFIPEGEHTRMIWVQHTDPNGALPGWLVNTLLVDIPVRSMQALEKVARKPRYQGFELVWDHEGNLKNVLPPAP